MDTLLQGAATHVVLGYVAVPHPTPGVGVLSMIWTHCSFVILVPVVANDIGAVVAKNRSSTSVNANIRPFNFELTFSFLMG